MTRDRERRVGPGTSPRIVRPRLYAYHEFCFYYEVALPSGSPYGDKANVYRELAEEREGAVLRWFPLAALNRITLRPTFLQEGLQSPPACTQHLVIHG